ncbi:hypothetical protein NKR23_g4013 [Pleurostoma richardsiae]|uniref:Uncharacterized protein n=1 Tax=Pleurostoma richardsiae TaxID=41990 RepID=A0AA38VL14_9PEZI|nr:hypothetical protein NKR23_g4013 [Pleurostoma richardsiae]
MTRHDYQNMVAREEDLRVYNSTLLQENTSLKAHLQRSEAEVHNLRQVVPQLQERIRGLEYENQELRRSLDSNSDIEQQLRHLRVKYTRVKNENETLVQRMRVLEQQLRDNLNDRVRKLIEEAKAWKHRAETVEVSNSRIQGRLDVAKERNCELEVRNRRLAKDLDDHVHEERRLLDKIRILEGIIHRR